MATAAPNPQGQITCPHCAQPLTPEEARAISDAYRASRAGKVGQPRSNRQRCACARMTLARARARGKSATEHAPHCDFYAAD